MIYTPGDLVMLDNGVLLTNIWVNEWLTSAWLGGLGRGELVVILETGNEFTRMTRVLSRYGAGYIASGRIMKVAL